MLQLLTGLLPVAEKVLDRVIPDPKAKQKALQKQLEEQAAQQAQIQAQAPEYDFDANLVRDIYAIFNRIYDGFDLGKPKVKKPLPTTFSLEMING